MCFMRLLFCFLILTNCFAGGCGSKIHSIDHVEDQECDDGLCVEGGRLCEIPVDFTPIVRELALIKKLDAHFSFVPFKTLCFLKWYINEFKKDGEGSCAELVLKDLCDFIHCKYPIYDDHLQFIFEKNGLELNHFEAI